MQPVDGSSRRSREEVRRLKLQISSDASAQSFVLHVDAVHLRDPCSAASPNPGE